MSNVKAPAVARISAKIEGAKKVTVGLKSPNGLVLRLFKLAKVTESSPTGPRHFEQHVPDQAAGSVTLKGYGGAAFGVKQDYRIVGQYALTENVDGDFMREWLKQNQEHDLVKNNLIFIQAGEADAAAQGHEQLKVWDGMHPLRMNSTKKDPRVPKRVKTLNKRDDDEDTMTAPEQPSAAA